MDPTAAFADLVAGPEAGIDLTRGALLIAAHSRRHRGLDVDRETDRIDRLAAGLDARVDAVRRRVFDEAGLAGNRTDYGDPRNSYLPDVLARRLGIPITLALVTIEVGRRAGVALHGVGMPGHFLVGVDGERWLDPFDGGRMLDVAGAAELYRRVHGSLAPFHRSFLGPTSTLAILSRMLTNLERSFVEREPAEATWAIRLHLTLPGLDPAVRAHLATSLGHLGSYSEAAVLLKETVEHLSGEPADAATRAARGFRARLN